MPINANHEFFSAEKEYLNAKSLEDKIYWLEEMIKTAPKHKSSENLLKELRVRLKKFKEKSEKNSKKSGGKKGIRKEGFQFVLVGLTNKGKSSLLASLTNATPKIAEYQFTTTEPEIGTFEFEGVKAQIIDAPSIGSDYYDSGLINTGDCLILVIEDTKELEEIEPHLKRARGTKIVAVNKIDKLSVDGLRKLEAKIKSKKIPGVLISAKTKQGLDELKKILFTKTGMIRIFMKEPGKGKQEIPMVLKAGSTIKDVADHIFKGFAKTVKETRLTGPSSKFPNQRVGINHKLKDLDIIEFHTR